MDLALTSYQDALEYLFARTTAGWRLGLDRTKALLRELGNPHHQYPVFHVGGTNGKGSVIATLDAVLRSAGWRVGRYTSPHLVDFRERILVDGRPVDAEDVTAWVGRWASVVERLGATFFEATTSMAFQLFASAEVDVAVVEVGLGGRLDSTNVVVPRAAAVASIALDHTQLLGGTLEEIALEKAGIFKDGRPAVIGEREPRLAALLASLARTAGADPVRVVGEGTRVEDVEVHDTGTAFTLVHQDVRRRLHTPLIGAHQAVNTAVALAMLEASGSPFAQAATRAAEALDRVWLPGRFQRVGSLVLDVAHNPASAAALGATLDAVRPPRPIVALVAILGDKDWPAILDTLARHVDRVVLTHAPSAPATRAWRAEDAVAYASARGMTVESVSDFGLALERAQEGAGTTIVTGSFHTVGDAMIRLQVAPFAG